MEHARDIVGEFYLVSFIKNYNQLIQTLQEEKSFHGSDFDVKNCSSFKFKGILNEHPHVWTHKTHQMFCTPNTLEEIS